MLETVTSSILKHGIKKKNKNFYVKRGDAFVWHYMKSTCKNYSLEEF